MGDRHHSGAGSDAILAGQLLHDYVSAVSEADASAVLNALFRDHLSVWCEQTARRTLRAYGVRGANQADEAEEVGAEVMLQITQRLQAIRTGTASPIGNLRAYAVTSVYNACFAGIRARCPQHVRLQNRIRYLLRNDRRFAVWSSGEGEQLAGLQRWQGTDEHVPAPVPERSSDPLPVLLRNVFVTANGALRLSDLIGVVAESLGLVEDRYVPVEDELSNKEIPADRVLIEQEGLAALWTEVLRLPAAQRSALLLNLRDGGGNGVIELIPATGTATFAELAEALRLPVASLAGVWNELPMEDSRIAGMLGVTRQQVINLRKSARDRLARRQRSSNMARSSTSGREPGPGMTGKIRALFQRRRKDAE